MLGRFSESLDCHIRSKELADLEIESRRQAGQQDEVNELTRLIGVSPFNRSLVYLDLYDLDKATILLNKCRDEYEQQIDWDDGDEKRRNLFCANSCLALIYSLKGEWTNSSKKLEWLDLNLDCKLDDAWSIGYTLAYRGEAYAILSIYDKSHFLLRKALDYSEESGYKQLKAKVLIKLAYLNRHSGDIKIAEKQLLESIYILKRISANTDLAEAYFQFGLLSQELGDTERCLDFKNKAIDLFEEMGAPKQVERVQKEIPASQ